MAPVWPKQLALLAFVAWLSQSACGNELRVAEDSHTVSATAAGLWVASETKKKVLSGSSAATKEEAASPTELFGSSRRRTSGGFSFSPRRRALRPAYSTSPRRRALPPGYSSPGYGAAGAAGAAGAGGIAGAGHGFGGSGVTVTHKSAGQIFQEKLHGAMVGFVLFVLAFPVLWFNEQRQAKMEALFGRAAKIARTNIDSEKVDPQNERCLVHTQGKTHTEEQLQDEVLGASIVVTGCAKLNRSTEMLQWVEESKEEKRDDNWGGEEKITTYSYSQEWRSCLEDSSRFNDSSYMNPSPPCELGDKLQTAKRVGFGAFTLPKDLVSGLHNFTNCTSESKLVGGSSGGVAHVAGSPATKTMPCNLPTGVTLQMAQGFLEALRKEYEQGNEGAVGDFFDSHEGASKEAGQTLASLESRVQSSGNPSSTISSLATEWGLASQRTALQTDMPTSSGGLHHAGSYIGLGSGNQVGDIRIKFEKVPCGPATVLAVQSEDSFEPMQHAAEISSDGKVSRGAGMREPLNPSTQGVGIDFDGGSASFSGGCCSCCQACGAVGTLIESGESIFQITERHASAKEVLQEAASAQNCCHTVGKYGGWLMMVIGLNMIFDPFPTLFRFIPFAGTYIQYFVGWITGVIAFLLGSALASLTIALAWLYARPAKSLQYFAVAGALIAGIYALAAMYSGDGNSMQSPPSAGHW